MDHTLQPLIAKLSQVLDLLQPLLERLDRPDSPAVLMFQWYGSATTACAVVWGFHSVGLGAALVLGLSKRFVGLPRSARLALAVLFSIFSLTTLLVVVQSTRVWNAAGDGVRSELRSMGRIQADAITATPLWLVVAVHLASVGCVAWLLWVQSRPRS